MNIPKSRMRDERKRARARVCPSKSNTHAPARKLQRCKINLTRDELKTAHTALCFRKLQLVELYRKLEGRLTPPGVKMLIDENNRVRKKIEKVIYPKAIPSIIFVFLFICNVAIAKDPRVTKDVVVPIGDPYRVSEKDLPMNFDPNNQNHYKIKFHEGITIKKVKIK